MQVSSHCTALRRSAVQPSNFHSRGILLKPEGIRSQIFLARYRYVSHVMRKPGFRLCENAKTKTQISCDVIAQLISPFVFVTRIVQFLLYFYPNFQDFSLLCVYRSTCVGPGGKSQSQLFSCHGSYNQRNKNLSINKTSSEYKSFERRSLHTEYHPISLLDLIITVQDFFCYL